jgi:molybdate transport system substrate-binding protein
MRILSVLLLFFITLNAGERIRIAVAANVSYAISELIRDFQKDHDSKIEPILGSSGKLTAQIRNHAPFDLFLSADMSYPKLLFKEGVAITKPIIYAKGALAIVTKKSRDLKEGLEILKRGDIKRIAIANPKTAPYGVAAKEALERAGLYEKLKKRFIYGESVSQTLTYALKAADIGIVAKSALLSKNLKYLQKDRNWVEVDEALYTPISQGAVILREGEEKRGVREFFEYLSSDRAKEIFKRYGYRVE